MSENYHDKVMESGCFEKVMVETELAPARVVAEIMGMDVHDLKHWASECWLPKAVTVEGDLYLTEHDIEIASEIKQKVDSGTEINEAAAEVWVWLAESRTSI